MFQFALNSFNAQLHAAIVVEASTVSLSAVKQCQAKRGKVEKVQLEINSTFAFVSRCFPSEVCFISFRVVKYDNKRIALSNEFIVSSTPGHDVVLSLQLLLAFYNTRSFVVVFVLMLCINK